MKKAMISQPMRNLTREQIAKAKEDATEELLLHGYEVVNTYFTDMTTPEGVVNEPLYYLAKSLEAMAHVDLVYFCHGWGCTRGCSIEHTVAVHYDVPRVYEDAMIWPREGE